MIISEYAMLLALVVLPPLVISLHPAFGFYHHLKHVFWSITISAIAFIIWDIYATNAGHWSFNPQYTSNIFFFNLPLEEVGFFFAIPYACLFIWWNITHPESIKRIYKSITKSQI